jgi:phospholipase C
VQQRPGPIIRPASIRRRRPTRRQVARRRALAASVVVLTAFLLWQFWPFGADGADRAEGQGPGQGGSGGGRGNPGKVVPGRNPIEHVIFMVKENRTFDHYFGTYPGADGATEGGTLRCGEAAGCRPSGTIPLRRAPYVQPHDITHGSRAACTRSTAAR